MSTSCVDSMGSVFFLVSEFTFTGSLTQAESIASKKKVSEIFFFDGNIVWQHFSVFLCENTPCSLWLMFFLNSPLIVFIMRKPSVVDGNTKSDEEEIFLDQIILHGSAN